MVFVDGTNEIQAFLDGKKEAGAMQREREGVVQDGLGLAYSLDAEGKDQKFKNAGGLYVLQVARGRSSPNPGKCAGLPI